MSFQSSRFAAIIPYQPPPASHSLIFCLFFAKPQNPIPFLDYSPFHFSPSFILDPGSRTQPISATPPTPQIPPHQKILTPSISSTSSRSRRPSPLHFQPIPAPPPQGREPITQRRNQTNAGSRPQRQIRHRPSGRHGPGQNPSRLRKRKAAPADGSKICASIELPAVPFKPPLFPPLFPAFPLHFLSIAPSQPFPTGPPIRISIELSPTPPNPSPQPFPTSPKLPVSIELSPIAPQSSPTGSKICASIELSAISPKPPQQPFSTGSKMRAGVSAGPKSGFKMRTAVFKWL